MICFFETEAGRCDAVDLELGLFGCRASRARALVAGTAWSAFSQNDNEMTRDKMVRQPYFG